MGFCTKLTSLIEKNHNRNQLNKGGEHILDNRAEKASPAFSIALSPNPGVQSWQCNKSHLQMSVRHFNYLGFNFDGIHSDGLSRFH